MKTLATVLITLLVVFIIAAGAVYGVGPNVAADEPHWSVTSSMLERVRDRSIARQSGDTEVPKTLADPQFIANGASEYAQMCTVCHLAPGMKDTELRKGLYPMPPNLAEHGAHRTAAEQFWIVKHGIKMTGMPAWGLTHDDERIWSMVAFLQKLPSLTPAQYQELVGSGEGGHSHDDGEDGHDHGASDEPGPSGEPAPSVEPGPPAGHSHEHGEHNHNLKSTALSESATEAAKVVDRFQRMLGEGNTAAASELLDPDVIIFEGGGVERSREEYASHHLGSDAEFMRGAAVKQLSRSGFARGDLAWIATESTVKSAGAKPADLVSTETMVLRRSTGGWRITHIHWSSRSRK
jgi:mono/diheme cytochrome c family protein